MHNFSYFVKVNVALLLWQLVGVRSTKNHHQIVQPFFLFALTRRRSDKLKIENDLLLADFFLNFFFKKYIFFYNIYNTVFNI